MHRINTTLKKANLRTDGTAPVYIAYHFDRKTRALFNTGKRLKPEDWNNDKGEVKRSHPDYEELNQYIVGRNALLRLCWIDLK